MPKLDTTLHLDMYRRGKQLRAKGERADIYGLEWGDPEVMPELQHVRDHFLRRYITADTTALEIGPGGGRWTRYMLAAKHIIAVDFHRELLDEVQRNVSHPNMTLITNNGDDFPGVADHSVDFIFSFGTFVHLDIEIIDRYLGNMKRVLRPESNVVIQYADKTKPAAQQNQTFSDNDPSRMRALAVSHGYAVIEEDLKTLWHSSIIRFGHR